MTDPETLRNTDAPVNDILLDRYALANLLEEVVTPLLNNDQHPYHVQNISAFCRHCIKHSIDRANNYKHIEKNRNKGERRFYNQAEIVQILSHLEWWLTGTENFRRYKIESSPVILEMKNRLGIESSELR